MYSYLSLPHQCSISKLREIAKIGLYNYIQKAKNNGFESSILQNSMLDSIEPSALTFINSFCAFSLPREALNNPDLSEALLLENLKYICLNHMVISTEDFLSK